MAKILIMNSNGTIGMGIILHTFGNLKHFFFYKKVSDLFPNSLLIGKQKISFLRVKLKHEPQAQN